MWTAPKSGTPTVQADLASDAQSGVLVLTVKRLNELVAKAVLDVAAARQADPNAPLALAVQAQIAQDDRLSFELSTRDRQLAESINGYTLSVQYPGDLDPITVRGALYYPAAEGLFSYNFV